MNRLLAFALLLIIALSVSVMFVSYQWASAIPETAPCILAALLMPGLGFGRRRFRYSPLLPAVAGVVLIGLVQIFAGVTIYQWPTWQSILYWVGNASVLFVGLQVLGDTENRSIFLPWLVRFGFVVAVISSLQALTTDAVVYWTFPTEYRGWVVMGPFVYHNQYAAFIELVLPPALFLAITDKTWRWFYLMIAAAMYASIFISGSRAGLVLTTIEMFAVPLAAVRSAQVPAKSFLRAAVLMVAMVLLLAVSAGPDYLVKRFQEKDPYSVRREFLYSSVRMFRDRPVMGFGLGNWSTAYPAYALFDDGLYANQAHNDWAQWAVEGGVLLVAVMLGIAVLIFPAAIRSGWGCGVAIVFVHCFVDYPIQRPAVAVVFFSLMAAIANGNKTSDVNLDASPDSV